eukprot:12836719-Alexandrium_andersonii.AAC.1
MPTTTTTTTTEASHIQAAGRPYWAADPRMWSRATACAIPPHRTCSRIMLHVQSLLSWQRPRGRSQ